jgi:predicted ATPase
MIASVQVSSGFVDKLPGFEDGKRVFRFSPGLNVIYGPNGSGKSTILKCLGRESGCDSVGGWGKGGRSTDVTWIKLNKVKAVVESNAAPVFLGMSDVEDAPVHVLGLRRALTPVDDSGTGFMSEVARCVFKISSGEERLSWLGKLMKELVAKYPDGGDFTVLLDEPDRSLDGRNQLLFWSTYIRNMAMGCQVIVVTHSPLSFVCKSAKFIDLVKGTVEQDCDKLKGLLVDAKPKIL